MSLEGSLRDNYDALNQQCRSEEARMNARNPRNDLCARHHHSDAVRQISMTDDL